jgi:hypothetical protein
MEWQNYYFNFSYSEDTVQNQGNFGLKKIANGNFVSKLAKTDNNKLPNSTPQKNITFFCCDLFPQWQDWGIKLGNSEPSAFCFYENSHKTKVLEQNVITIIN